MHVRVLLLLLAAATLALSACGEGGDPRPDLLFVSTRDGDYALYAMNADGGRQERLTRADVDASSPEGLFFQTDPAWSPDGATIAFASRRSGTFDIYVMRADGTSTRQLTRTPVDDTHPTWAPDGRRLAFKRADDIYVMKADGTSAQSISRGSGSDSDPAWSPDGKSIAFTRRLSGTQEREIWLMRPDGSHARRLTTLRGVSINPAWSPDGSRIVFASNIVGSLYDLYLVDVAGTRVHRLTKRGPDTFNPAWSPDGLTIAFSQDGSISTTDLKGQTGALTDTKNNDSSPTWNPVPPPDG
jgi:Tol biopolymer transport system component